MNVAAQARLILRNDLRLLWRERSRGKRKAASRILLAAVILAGGHAVTILIFSHSPSLPLGGEAAAWALFGFMMLGMSMNTVIRMFFERADFDLLLASPLQPRAILLARLSSLTVAAFLSVALFLLPLLDGVIIGISPRYFSGYAVWLMLAAAVASVGTWLTLSLVRLLGPARARTWVQVLAAVLGTAVYLSFQLQNYLPMEDRLTYVRTLQSVVDSSGLTLIARAGRGSALDLCTLAAATAVLLAITTRQLARTFLHGLQESNVRPSSKQRSAPYTFVGGLARATFRKDFRLIVRDPMLLTHVLPSAMYIAPAFLAFRKFGGATMLAPVAVVVATQFSTLLTEVAAAGEECLDLIRMSPSPEVRLRLAKMGAAMTLPLALALLISVGVGALSHWIGGVATFLAAAGTAAGASWLHVARIEPTARKDLLGRRRRRGSFGRDMAIGLLMTASCAGVALVVGATFWWLGLGFLGLSALGITACFVLVDTVETDVEKNSLACPPPPATTS
jgi:ABC-2 type transport system permease protein